MREGGLRDRTVCGVFLMDFLVFFGEYKFIFSVR